MLVPGELKSELARILPARACCRRAELEGLLASDRLHAGVRTFDHGTARIAVQLAASLGRAVSPPPAGRATARHGARHHLVVHVASPSEPAWQWREAAPHDRRAWLRGLLLGGGSISLGPSGPHVEFVLRTRARARELLRRLGESGVRGRQLRRRGRWVVYLKGRDEVATLLRLTGANRGVVDFEAASVEREVRNRLNRLLNAEEANLSRTVRAADRQVQAIRALDASGRLGQLSEGLRAAAAERVRNPEADLEAVAGALGISRSAANHRLRRLVELACPDAADATASTPPLDPDLARDPAPEPGAHAERAPVR